MVSLFDHSRFHLLRHGQTAANAAGLICGATDVPLIERGHQQAEAAARAWQDLAVGRLLASPLLRARQTAEAVVRQRPGLAIQDAPMLAERNWGIWEGRPRAILVRAATPDGGEGPGDFRSRIRAGIHDIPAPRPAEAPPLIVAHSGTVREILALLDLPFLRPGNCTLITVTRGAFGQWSATPPQAAPDIPVSNPERIA